MALVLAASAAWLAVPAQRVFDMDLWQGKVKVKGSDPADTAKVRVFLPEAKNATGRAVVICPGGGYEHLAMGHEGYDWGPFFNDLGIAAVVLKYRMPHGNPDITMLQGYAHQGSRDNLLGTDVKKKTERYYCSDRHVTRTTPRACIILSDDDDIVQPSNGVNYYSELFRYDVPAALYVYPSGGHGYGLQSSFKYHVEMMLDLRAWLRSF